MMALGAERIISEKITRGARAVMEGQAQARQGSREPDNFRCRARHLLTRVSSTPIMRGTGNGSRSDT